MTKAGLRGDKRFSTKIKIAFLIIVAAVFLFKLGKFIFIVYDAQKKLAYRYEDYDKDGIINMNDGDIDGDGIPNMQDPDADGDGIPNTVAAVAAAEALIGRPYDMLAGKFFNIGGKMGSIVCIDVVNLSLEKAGLYMEKEMRDYYMKNPAAFSDKKGDKPGNTYFARRVKNLREYCEANGYILPPGARVKPCDIIIFGTTHTAFVEKLKDGGGYYAIEADVWPPITSRIDDKHIIADHGHPVYARLPFFK